MLQQPRISQLQKFYLYQASLSDFRKLVATISRASFEMLRLKIVNCKN